MLKGGAGVGVSRPSAARAGTVSRAEGEGRARARSRAESDTLGRTPRVCEPQPFGRLLGEVVLAIGLSIGLSLAAQWAGHRLPAMGSVMNPASWTILLVTTAALILSLTPLRKIGRAEVSRLGTFALYALLASIGARANFQAIAQAPVFLALGVTWILIHGLVQFAGGFFLKAPLGLIAAASQANIGGTISAPIVGATFSAELATVGLLMAVLGNILGTYLGLLTAFLAR